MAPARTNEELSIRSPRSEKRVAQREAGRTPHRRPEALSRPVPTLGAALAMALVATGACGDPDDAPRPSVVMDTVDGIPRVTSTGHGLWEAGEAWRIGEPVLTLGTLDGEGPTVFGAVRGVLVRNGRVHVIDGQAAEVRVFDRATGEHVRSFGRSGEGPGEFLYADGLAPGPNGTLAVRDARLARVTLFDGEGAFVRSFRLERPFFILTNGDGFWGDRRGRLYDRLSFDGVLGQTRTGVIVYEPSGAVADTVAGPLWSAPHIELTQGGLRRATTRVPYSPAGFVAVGTDGTVATALGGSYEVELTRLPETSAEARGAPEAGPRDTRGTEEHRIRRDLPAAPLAGAERDSAEAAVLERIGSLREATGGGDVSAWSLPEVIPFIGGLILDDAGALWVARDGFGASPPRRFDVFDAEGRLLGSAELPLSDLRVVQIGHDFVAGVHRDELDVERVVILPLERG